MTVAEAVKPSRKKREKPAVEERQFNMHNQLLLDVITRQAGTLNKAILELVMNSLDARATKCSITLEEGRVLVEDNGEGIQKRVHIEKFFETFGQPHEDNEKKTYGTFRMGRGQAFSYGHNLWRTGPFEMDVDIKERGLKYLLKGNEAQHAGCRVEITLYKPIEEWVVRQCERELKESCRYVWPCCVELNGKPLNVDPATQEWSHVADGYYLDAKPEAQGIKVYNLGILVQEIWQARAGCGGVLVSRKQLKLNFARNEVMSDCPVWQRAQKDLRQIGDREIYSHRKLSRPQQRTCWQRIEAGKWRNWSQLSSLKIVPLQDGRVIDLSDLSELLRERKERLVIADRKDDPHDLDQLNQQGLAVVISSRFREWFSDVDDFVNLLQSWQPDEFKDMKLCKPGILAKQLAREYVKISPKEYTELDRAWLQVAGFACYAYCHPVDRNGQRQYCDKRGGRLLEIGRSSHAAAWTDGKHFVCFDQSFLARLELGLRGCAELCTTLLHEYCHLDSNIEEHGHGPEFYQRFHDLSQEVLGTMIEDSLKALLRVSKKLPKKLTRGLVGKAERWLKSTTGKDQASEDGSDRDVLALGGESLQPETAA